MASTGLRSTFRTLNSQIGLVPAATARTLGAIDTARGREEAFRLQRPRLLETLVDVARVQSTEASSAIEGIEAPRQRIEALVAERAMPRNRPERRSSATAMSWARSTGARRTSRSSRRSSSSSTAASTSTRASPPGSGRPSRARARETLPDGTVHERFPTVAAAETGLSARRSTHPALGAAGLSRTHSWLGPVGPVTSLTST